MQSYDLVTRNTVIEHPLTNQQIVLAADFIREFKPHPIEADRADAFFASIVAQLCQRTEFLELNVNELKELTIKHIEQCIHYYNTMIGANAVPSLIDAIRESTARANDTIIHATCRALGAVLIITYPNRNPVIIKDPACRYTLFFRCENNIYSALMPSTPTGTLPTSVISFIEAAKSLSPIDLSSSSNGPLKEKQRIIDRMTMPVGSGNGPSAKSLFEEITDAIHKAVGDDETVGDDSYLEVIKLLLGPHPSEESHLISASLKRVEDNLRLTKAAFEVVALIQQFKLEEILFQTYYQGIDKQNRHLVDTSVGTLKKSLDNNSETELDLITETLMEKVEELKKINTKCENEKADFKMIEQHLKKVHKKMHQANEGTFSRHIHFNHVDMSKLLLMPVYKEKLVEYLNGIPGLTEQKVTSIENQFNALLEQNKSLWNTACLTLTPDEIFGLRTMLGNKLAIITRSLVKENYGQFEKSFKDSAPLYDNNKAIHLRYHFGVYYYEAVDKYSAHFLMECEDNLLSLVGDTIPDINVIVKKLINLIHQLQKELEAKQKAVLDCEAVAKKNYATEMKKWLASSSYRQAKKLHICLDSDSNADCEVKVVNYIEGKIGNSFFKVRLEWIKENGTGDTLLHKITRHYWDKKIDSNKMKRIDKIITLLFERGANIFVLNNKLEPACDLIAISKRIEEIEEKEAKKQPYNIVLNMIGLPTISPSFKEIQRRYWGLLYSQIENLNLNTHSQVAELFLKALKNYVSRNVDGAGLVWIDRKKKDSRYKTIIDFLKLLNDSRVMENDEALLASANNDILAGTRKSPHSRYAGRSNLRTEIKAAIDRILFGEERHQVLVLRKQKAQKNDNDNVSSSTERNIQVSEQQIGGTGNLQGNRDCQIERLEAKNQEHEQYSVSESSHQTADSAATQEAISRKEALDETKYDGIPEQEMQEVRQVEMPPLEDVTSLSLQPEATANEEIRQNIVVPLTEIPLGTPSIANENQAIQEADQNSASLPKTPLNTTTSPHRLWSRMFTGSSSSSNKKTSDLPAVTTTMTKEKSELNQNIASSSSDSSSNSGSTRKQRQEKFLRERLSSRKRG